jgi:single-strand DNA-binding protein
MANESYFAVAGYVATQPRSGRLPDGSLSLSMRVAWTPRVVDRATGQWTDRETSFVTVNCYRKIAENAWLCLRRGDPITVRGTLRVREYIDQAGAKRNSVDVVADSLGHDMSRGLSHYSKPPQHAEPTAEEFELSPVTDRTPLPGDVAALGRANGQLATLLHAGERSQLAADDDADDESMGLPDSDLAGPPDSAGLRDSDSAGAPDSAGLPDVPDSESEQPDAKPVGSRRGGR